MPSKRALFLDRDGVINHDAGYTSKMEDFQYIDGIFELGRAAQQANYILIVVTNQSGIGRGFYSEDEFLDLTEWMKKRFSKEGTPLTDVFYCPFHPEHGIGQYKKESYERKPNPGMLLRAAEIHGIDMHYSIMIGDKDTDMLAARRAGVGIACQYLDINCNNDSPSSAATHTITTLKDAITLLNMNRPCANFIEAN